jgi:DNA invertase Pin-like site-specific DNA recombinase
MADRRLIAYLRVGPKEPVGERPELDDQLAAINAACDDAGWELVGVERETRSGRQRRRLGLRGALAACRAGQADGIIVARLDRLTYNIGHLAELVSDAGRDGFAIVSLAPAVDLDSEQGAMLGAVLSEAASWSPRSIVRRAEVLARSKAEDAIVARRPGRPTSTPVELAERIRAMRERGLTLQAICDTLNREGVPTPRGGVMWRPTSLRSILAGPRA